MDFKNACNKIDLFISQKLFEVLSHREIYSATNLRHPLPMAELASRSWYYFLLNSEETSSFQESSLTHYQAVKVGIGSDAFLEGNISSFFLSLTSSLLPPNTCGSYKWFQSTYSMPVRFKVIGNTGPTRTHIYYELTHIYYMGRGRQAMGNQETGKQDFSQILLRALKQVRVL